MAQTGTDFIVSTNCSICRGKNKQKRDAINSSLAKGVSYRDIEAMTGVAYRTVGNHAQHLPDIYREAKQQDILGQTINHQNEIKEQFRFAKRLRTAAEEYLTDPNDPDRLILIPSADEIEIVYLDHNDCTQIGERLVPKRKRAPLSNILEEIYKDGSKEADKWIAKHVDLRSFALRSFALDAIKTADIVLDKIAKVEGLYQQPRENSDELTQLKRKIERRAAQRSVSYEDELNLYLNLFGEEIKPEIKQELTSNLVQ